VSEKIYSIDEIRTIIRPVAQRYGVERVALFGSYARGDANAESDADFRIDSGAIRGYIKLAGFRRELEEALQIPVDVLTTGALEPQTLAKVQAEEVIVYE
jgi:Predicted nucleotidyltransferases